MGTRARSLVVALAVCCVAIAGAVAANVALLGIADHSHDRIGRLHMRLARPQTDSHSTTTVAAPVLVVTPPAAPPANDGHEGPDD